MRALLKGVSQCPHLPFGLFSVIRFWSCLPMDIFDTQSYLRSTGFPWAQAAGLGRTGMLVRTLQRAGWEPVPPWVPWVRGSWPASDRYAGKDITTDGVGTRLYQAGTDIIGETSRGLDGARSEREKSSACVQNLRLPTCAAPKPITTYRT